MAYQTLAAWILIVSTLLACSEPTRQIDGVSSPPESDEIEMLNANPLLVPSQFALGYPPFNRIATAHFLPAFEQGMAEQVAEIKAIAEQSAGPSFANTLLAMELSGQLLNRIEPIFNSLARAHSDNALRAIEQQIRPLLAMHDDSIMHNSALFARIQSLYTNRATLNLDAESSRLLERYYLDFQRAGAALDEASKAELRQLNSDIALLQTQYSQNILNEMNELAVVVADPDDLKGLAEQDIAKALERAKQQNLENSYLIALQNTTTQPVLALLENRDLRRYIHQLSLSRGGRGGNYDNREILSRLLNLRAQRAALLGYASHADYVLELQTAGSIAAVNERLTMLAAPASRNLEAEAAQLQALIESRGDAIELAAWDWSYYAEQLRKERFSVAEAELKPYFELNNVLNKGVFYAAEQLYGLSFKERFDLPVYHPTVRVFEVIDVAGTTLALFVADYFQRPSKRGGAWSSSLITQSGLLQAQPVVANFLNIPAPAEDAASLLSLAEVNTLFHEFGHALHSMFSNVQYPYFGGTRVPRDFVEFPSQVNEIWATWPEVLQNYALHYQTGEPIPEALMTNISEARNFNQGYATVEYLAAALLDLAMHELAVGQIPEAEQILDFENNVLSRAGLSSPLVPPRYRSTYFNHIVGGYAAGYYSYIWSEVLDADTASWFAENGGLRRANGDHFRRTLLSRGGTEDAMVLFRQFRDRDADIEPLLQRRGLNNREL